MFVWHHEACRGMTNGDSEGQIFLSHPHKNNIEFISIGRQCDTKLHDDVKLTQR